jgi:WD40 repeat protein
LTPKPLVVGATAPALAAGAGGGETRPTTADKMSVSQGGGRGMTMSSVFGGGSREALETLIGGSGGGGLGDDVSDTASVATHESDAADEGEEAKSAHTAADGGALDARAGGARVRQFSEQARAEGLSETALESLVTLRLTETPTVRIFSERAVRQFAGSAEEKDALAENARYEDALAHVAKFRDELFTSRGVGRPALSTKNKEITVVPPQTRAAEAQAASWDIHDVMRTRVTAADADGADEPHQSPLESVVRAVVSVAVATPGCLIDADAQVAIVPEGGGGGAVPAAAPTAPPAVAALALPPAHLALAPPPSRGSTTPAFDLPGMSPVAETPRTPMVADGAAGAGDADFSVDSVAVAQERDRIFASHSFVEKLALSERCVQQNAYHDSHKLYRAGPALDLNTRLLAAGATPLHGHVAAAAVLGVSHAAAAAERDARGSPPADAASRPPTAALGDDDRSRAASAATAISSAGVEGAAGGVGAAQHLAAFPETPVVEAPRVLTAAEAAQASAAAAALAAELPAPGLARLWSYASPALAGCSVSCMSWCRAPGANDLLAVGYGPTDFSAAQGTGAAAKGRVALWTLANPTHPVALLSSPDGVGVTSILFSSVNKRMLAIGCYDGTLAVFDAGRVLEGGPTTPTVVSERSLGAHTEPVWQLQWLPRADVTDGQVLVSISTDGRVCEWVSKKGVLVPRQLMTLKRTLRAKAPAGDGAAKSGSQGLLSRNLPGLSFEFVRDESGAGADAQSYTTYWAGMEDGTLARCSTSYSEQYLDALQAHAGPINRVRLSPFSHDAMLTASADWSIKLWNTATLPAVAAAAAIANSQEYRPPCLTFTTDSVKDAIVDVVWSPTLSTRFASVTRDGQVQVRQGVMRARPFVCVLSYPLLTPRPPPPNFSSPSTQTQQVWEAAGTALTPVINKTVCIEPEEWAAQLEIIVRGTLRVRSTLWSPVAAHSRPRAPPDLPTQAFEKEQRAQKAADEMVRKVLEERGDDEAPEPELVEACLAEARLAEGLPPVAGSRAKKSNAESKVSKEEEEEGAAEREAAAAAASDAAAAAAGASSAAGGPAQPPPPPPPPRKRLTCVLFADSNTQVLLTGDDRGRVDVYRVVGLSGQEDADLQLELLRGVVSTLKA